MGEDYTYDAVTDVTTLRRQAQEANQYALCIEDKANELATRVQELERALAQADSNMVALAARNAQLRARLDAVPVEAITKLRMHLSEDGDYSICREDDEKLFIGELIMFGSLFDAVDAWLDATDTQPDDTDAPLTLAAIDEDGDE